MTSVWNWNTGQPSIFGSMQKDANIAKKASENLGARFRTDPVPTLRKKPNRDGSGRTTPLSDRIDLDAAYEYRISGKTWDQVAERFGCSGKHIHKKLTEIHPELLGTFFITKPASTNRPKDIDIEAVIRDILGGMSIRQAAPKYGISHVTLGRKLKATNRGSYAVEVATSRAIGANVQAMNKAKLKAESEKRKAK
jgi:hypothetical protein